MKFNKEKFAKAREAYLFSQKEKDEVLADVDDGVNGLTKIIQKKYKLPWAGARDLVNYSLRRLMLSFPERWLK